MTEGSCHHPAPFSSPPMSPGTWDLEGKWRRSSRRLCTVVLLAAGVALLLVSPCVVFSFKPTWEHGGEAGQRTLLTSTSQSNRGEQARGDFKAHAAVFGSPLQQQQQLNETPRNLSRRRVLGTPSLELERQGCTRNPLWDKETNITFTNYEFGCKEIMEMLGGEKELIAHGAIRYVYLVQHGERKLVVKAIQAKFEQLKGTKQANQKHRREATVSDAVGRDPNIVEMLGVCAGTLVSPFLPKSLGQLVLTPGVERLPMSSLVSMALDATRGLQALHEAAGGPIVHFDIKPQQLMLDENGTVKLTDFNLCKYLDTDADGNTCPLKMSKSHRPGAWRAPENVAGEDISEKLDVYSMGMVFYSMLALRPPFLGHYKERESQILGGILPPVDPSWHQGFVEIMRDMWKRDPEMRPSAREVVQRLEILQNELAL